MKKNKIILITVLICLFGLLLFLSGDFLTPYCNIDEAKKSERVVQVIGIPVKNSPVSLDKEISFYIEDKTSDMMKVVTKERLPMNFYHANKIVVIGTFNKENSYFLAKKILLQCPSKYKEKASSTK